MKYPVALLVASFLYCASALGTITPVNDWRMCDGCSDLQMQQCAIEVATVEDLQTGKHVWIFDFENWVASKYYLEVTPPGTIIQGKGNRDDRQLTRSGLIIAIPQALFAREVVLSDALFEMVDVVWRPRGWGYHYPACGQFGISSLEWPDHLEDTESTTQSQPVMTYPVNIPPGPDQDSAYDIIGRQALALQLAQAHQGPVAYLGEVQSWVANFVRANPVNTETSIRLVFSDGSSGIWRFNFETNRWEPDWSTFEDSDGNPIPLSSNDLAPGMGFEFSGSEPGEQNLQRFLDRAAMLDIPITGPGGGDGPILVRCDVTSNGISCVFRSP